MYFYKVIWQTFTRVLPDTTVREMSFRNGFRRGRTKM